MFSRHSPGASLSRWFSNNPRRQSRLSGIDRIMDAKRGYSRRLFVEPLEERMLLAADIDTNLTIFEPHVAVNPANPANIVASQFNQIVISTNYGQTFGAPVNATLPPALQAANYNFGGDSVLAFNAQGTTLYWTYLATVDTDGNGTNEDQTVIVQRVNPLTGAQIGNSVDLSPGNFSDDKSWIAVDNNAQSPFAGNVYVVWTRLDGNPDQLMFARSTDGGVTFSAPALISDPNGADNILGSPDDEEFVWPSHVTTAKNGDLYVAYHSDDADPGEDPTGGPIFVLRSSNGGADFVAGTVNQKSTAFPAGTAQMNDNVQTDAATIAGTDFWTLGALAPYLLADPVRPGRIYIVGNDDPNNAFGNGDEGNVVFAISEDNGLTWAAPQTISHGPVGTLQVFPIATIDELGNIAVFWYDNRRGAMNAGGNFLLDLYATASRDGGLTFSNDFRINDAPFDPDLNAPQRFPGPPQTLRIGEYNGIAASQGVVHLVWTGNDTVNMQQEVFYDQFNILGPFADAWEENGSLATATILGSLPKITIADATLDSPEDIDFYKYTAQDTGKLIVNALFNDGVANLRLRMLDSAGNVIATGTQSQVVPGLDMEGLVIPVVSQQQYWIEASYDPTEIIGNPLVYDLEIENFAAPAPAFVDLTAASDTGMMNDDNITSDTTPTFLIQADLVDFRNMGITLLNQAVIDPNNDGNANDATDDGAGVFLTLVNLTTGAVVSGFANQVGVAGFLWTFTSAALTAGDYFVSAAVQIVDGQQDPNRATGRAQLSDPLFITIESDSPAAGTFDLLSSSDTGMFNDDNVTNKMQSAFGGTGPANGKVRVFAQPTNAAGMPAGAPLLVGNGVVGSDATDGMPGNGIGRWEVTVEPLADGKYNFFADFENAAGVLSDTVGTAVVLTQTNNTAQPIPNPGTLNSTITFAQPQPATIADVNVTINITHPIDADLDIFLISPSGTEIELSTDNGGDGDNYTGTIFNDSAVTSITAGTAPFTGSFRPEEPLANLIGESVLGTWTLRIVDDSTEGAGMLVNWSLTIQTALMVVIDTVEPNTPFLDLLDDTGRNNNDNITKDNTPLVSMTTTDPNIALARLLFTDNLKFRIFDRYQSTIGAPAPEILIYDSALDPVADAFMTAGDMFTAATQLTKMLPFLTPLSPAITAGTLSDGVHNLKLEVEDRAGNISHDFLLQIVVDTVTPKVSFGLPTVALANQTDGLNAASDTGVTTSPATFADRITSDTTPTLWGRAEANSVVRVYVDRNADGVIDLTTDTFIGQTVATPFDGNDGFVDTNGNPLGFWELTSVVDLNQILGVPKDGLRRLLVTAEDVAGNPVPVIVQDRPVINQGIESLHIFIDTQGPQITDVTPNDLTSAQYDLFDPKPALTGFTPLVTSLKIAFRDLPARVDQNAVNINDFLYAALQGEIALSPGNYLLVGDNVGNIPIQSIQLSNPGPTQATRNLTAVLNTSTVTVGGFVGAAIQPQVGDYVLFNNGPAAGQARRIISYSDLTGQMTFDTPLLNLPAVGNSLTLTKFATAVVTLNFASPLPDDRYTLTVRDNLVDPANNKLDGESNAVQPQEDPFFPTGDGVPGGSFVARFTIDSRPEIGVYVSQDIDIDINGNFIWDPGVGPIGSDAFNVDISFTLPVQNAGGSVGQGGFNVHDLLFAGKFVRPGNTALARPFDQLAAFGFSQQLNVFRWLVDTNSDGVITLGTDILNTQPTLGNFNVAGAIPVAGNFDNIGSNGDEIGLYNAGKWALDTNHNFVIDGGDTFITGNLLGHPIVGNFDGNLNPDGSPRDDFAVFNNNQFFFDLNANGTWDQMMTWGFPGVLDRPVAADMDGDGIDDIGLWVPRTGGTLPRGIAEWYFLISNDPTGNLRQTSTINRLNHAFTPIPFGKDIFTEFGDELSLPIVGNFDPPVTPAVGGATMPGDYDRNGRVETADKMVWYAGFGSTTNMAADGNGDGRVDTADFVVWKNNFGRIAGAGAGAGAAIDGRTEATALAIIAASLFPAPAPDVVRVGWVEERDPTVAISPTDESPVKAPAHRPLRASSVDDFFAQLDPRQSSSLPAPRQPLAASFWRRDDLLLATLTETRSAVLTQAGSDFAQDEDADDDLFDELLAELVPFALDRR